MPIQNSEHLYQEESAPHGTDLVGLGALQPAPELPSGLYRHYKGKNYRVYGCAQHSETNEMLVVYQPLYGEQRLFVRPLEMFTEEIEIEGRRMKRFQLTEE